MNVDKDQTINRIRQSRTFILGAGFSCSAGIPMTGNLLEKAMQMFQQECNGIYERVCNSVRSCFGLDYTIPVNWSHLSFSEVCTFLHYCELSEYAGGQRWSSYGARELLAFRFYLAKAVSSLTPDYQDIPQLYIDFVKQLKVGDIIISFNWDCLLEKILLNLNKSFSYTLKIDSISLFKMHGSVNWRFKLNNYNEPLSEPTLNWQEIWDGTGMDDGVLYWNRDLIDYIKWKDFLPLREIKPVLILPGFGKMHDLRAIASLWYDPAFRFAITNDVYVIGLSLARDDFVIRSYFMDTFPYLKNYTYTKDRQITIINPDPLVRDNFGFLVGTEGVRFLCEPFSEKHIELMVSTALRLSS